VFFSFGGGGWHEKGIMANVKRVMQLAQRKLEGKNPIIHHYNSMAHSECIAHPCDEKFTFLVDMNKHSLMSIVTSPSQASPLPSICTF